MLKVSVGGGTSDENEMCNECGVADVLSGFAIPSELHDYGFLALQNPVETIVHGRGWLKRSVWSASKCIDAMLISQSQGIESQAAIAMCLQ